VKYFRASKSSVSNSLNFLLQNKKIEYKTFASDPILYFFITDLFFTVYFIKVLENVLELREYAYKTDSMRTPEYPVGSKIILKWIEDANTFQETLESTLDFINNEKTGTPI
jgi:hypothetical protein